MTDLNRKVGEMNYDGLITDLTPPVQVRGRTIGKLTAETTYPRGTALAKSVNDGKLYILGSDPKDGDTLVPDCVLCDDTDVGASSDVNAAVYTAGCFDPGKVTVADGYTITEADMDELRMRDIVFKAPFDAN